MEAVCSPERWYLLTSPHGVTTQKTHIDVFGSVIIFTYFGKYSFQEMFKTKVTELGPNNIYDVRPEVLTAAQMVMLVLVCIFRADQPCK
jgi:hypothetical protein